MCHSAVGDLSVAMQVDVKNDDVKFAARVGKASEATITNQRSLKMSFRNQGTREEIFTNAKLLPRTDFHAISRYSSRPDRHAEARRQRYLQRSGMDEPKDDSQGLRKLFLPVHRKVRTANDC